jgi:hypothetical protein
MRAVSVSSVFDVSHHDWVASVPKPECNGSSWHVWKHMHAAFPSGQGLPGTSPRSGVQVAKALQHYSSPCPQGQFHGVPEVQAWWSLLPYI